jgi:hypothetical protein
MRCSFFGQIVRSVDEVCGRAVCFGQIPHRITLLDTIDINNDGLSDRSSGLSDYRNRKMGLTSFGDRIMML